MSGLTAVTVVPGAATARADSPISRVIEAVVFGLITMRCTGPPDRSGSVTNSSSPGGTVASAASKRPWCAVGALQERRRVARDERAQHRGVVGVQAAAVGVGDAGHRPVRLGEVPRRPDHRREPPHPGRFEQREVEPAALPVVGGQIAVADRPVQVVERGSGPARGRRVRRRSPPRRAPRSPAPRAPRTAPAARTGRAGPRCTRCGCAARRAPRRRGSSATRAPG